MAMLARRAWPHLGSTWQFAESGRTSATPIAQASPGVVVRGGCRTCAGSSMSENDWGPDLKVWSIFWPLMDPVRWKLWLPGAVG
jgi:hypothetical protein